MREYVPAAAFVIVPITLLCLVLHVCFAFIPSFSDAFNTYISGVFRRILAYLSNILPFSVAEALLILLPIIAVAVIAFCYKHYTDTWKKTIKCVTSLLSVVLVVYSLFVLMFAAGYKTHTLDERLDIERADVSAEQLYNTAVILRDELEKLDGDILFSTTGASVMPYGYDELSDKLLEAYDRLSEKYPFINNFYSRVKPVVLSEPMTYTHISGVYSFFTGEANVNVNYPDYVIAYTAAHEMAHQRGIARENEANFIAFLVCLESDDPYIRYSAYLNMFEYVIDALYRADKELYSKVYLAAPTSVKKELSAYDSFFEKYRKNVASTVSGAINNSYLVIQGTPGTKSYGMVVDLAVAYYEQNK